MIAADINKYIGRDYETYNCFDLVKEFYLDKFGIQLKNYFEGNVVPDKEEVEFLIISNKGDFVEIAGKPIFGDIVVIRLYGVECHIGVCLDDKIFLHSAKKIGSNIERISKYSRLIAGYFRHRDNNVAA